MKCGETLDLEGKSKKANIREGKKKKKVNNHKKLVCPRLKKRPENVPTVFFFKTSFLMQMDVKVETKIVLFSSVHA